ncbi:IS200/IS605 family transposase [bacterium]|nr:IS200/IS605 family transposase [bacterium]MCB2179006.1 IS200/IS605 family transposase [bacterium]
MRAPYTQLYVHLIWATWERLPLITSDIEQPVYKVIGAKCQALKCLPLAIGGIEDHIHVLVRLNANISIAQLVKEIKGVSSHLASRSLEPDGLFKWQGGYGAFTLRKSEVETVIAYIESQKVHHQLGNIKEEWERSV